MARSGKCISILLAIMAMLAGGCEKRPEGVLSDAEMEKLLTDMLLADALEQSAPGRELPDSVRLSLGESVMKAHGVDYATLDSTYGWYAKNLDLYYKMYARVEKRLDKTRRDLAGRGRKNEVILQNDIWELSRHLQFNRLGTGESVVFELPGDAIESGERLEWKMHLSNIKPTILTLGIDYSDGTIAIIDREYRNDQNPVIRLVSDTARQPVRIYGVMSVSRNDMPLYVDSIALLKQPFDSVEYRNAWAQRLLYGPRSKVLPKPMEVAADSIMKDSVK